MNLRILSCSLLLCACTEAQPPEGDFRNLPLQTSPGVTRIDAPLSGAVCEIEVDGRGRRDMETDYLPHVIACEAAGSAGIETLKAQAVAARSVAYYAMELDGSICDGQGCQVYSCNNEPKDIHFRAVEETEGVYLMSHDTLTYAFYVAGDSTPNNDCVGNSGSTEKWVTYNEGKSGTNVEQTRLGWRHDSNDRDYGQNRGCMSQWGAVCLEDDGADWIEILEFFYGRDIEIERARGACVSEGGSGSSSGSDGGHDDDDCNDSFSPAMDRPEDNVGAGGEDRGDAEGCNVGGSTAPVFALLPMLVLFGRRRRVAV